jgi:hypothetical protein
VFKMTTLVSAFIDRYSYDPITPTHSLDFYLEHGKALLDLDYPKIIYMEPHIISIMKGRIDTAKQTTIIPFTKEEMEFWPERQRFMSCPAPPNGNPNKDTHDYVIIQLNKVAWCTRASILNPYNTQLFMWVDYGINYLLRNMSLKNAVEYIQPSRVLPNTIHIPGCQYFHPPSHPSQLVWKYCGSLFCGDRETLQKMQSDQRDVVMRLLDAGYVTWEVTVWYHMNAPYFDRYIADHNATMFTHF